MFSKSQIVLVMIYVFKKSNGVGNDLCFQKVKWCLWFTEIASIRLMRRVIKC